MSYHSRTVTKRVWDNMRECFLLLHITPSPLMISFPLTYLSSKLFVSSFAQCRLVFPPLQGFYTFGLSFFCEKHHSWVKSLNLSLCIPLLLDPKVFLYWFLRSAFFPPCCPDARGRVWVEVPIPQSLTHGRLQRGSSSEKDCPSRITSPFSEPESALDHL